MRQVYAVEINQSTFAGAKIGNISTLMNFIIPVVGIVAAVTFLGMILYAAYTWMTAGDKAENVTKAQQTIIWALVGLGLISLSYIIVKVVGVVFNVSDQLPL